MSVGKGTAGGELLRRYWHPIAVANEVQDLPVAVRALGEDLILVRTPQGRFGLVYPRCCHRGTTLLNGKVEDHGIALWRKLYRQAINTVQEGGDPPLAFGANEVRIEVRAAALIVPAGDVVAS